jgi:hypothetical protein
VRWPCATLDVTFFGWRSASASLCDAVRRRDERWPPIPWPRRATHLTRTSYGVLMRSA